MAIIQILSKAATRPASALDSEMATLAACMNAMLDGIAALEAQGRLPDGFAASAEPVQASQGTFDILLTVSGP
jgi:hypothetical protein